MNTISEYDEIIRYYLDMVDTLSTDDDLSDKDVVDALESLLGDIEVSEMLNDTPLIRSWLVKYINEIKKSLK